MIKDNLNLKNVNPTMKDLMLCEGKRI